jgi:hypothetical protein
VSEWVLLLEGFLLGFSVAVILRHLPRRRRKALNPEARVFGAEGWVYSEDGTKASWGGKPASGYFDFSVVSANESVQVPDPPPERVRDIRAVAERPVLRLVESERALLDDCTEMKGCTAELHLSTCPEKRSA